MYEIKGLRFQVGERTEENIMFTEPEVYKELKKHEIAPEYIPYMLRERQEKLNNKLQTLWMIRKEFEK